MRARVAQSYLIRTIVRYIRFFLCTLYSIDVARWLWWKVAKTKMCANTLYEHVENDVVEDIVMVVPCECNRPPVNCYCYVSEKCSMIGSHWWNCCRHQLRNRISEDNYRVLFQRLARTNIRKRERKSPLYSSFSFSYSKWMQINW